MTGFGTGQVPLGGGTVQFEVRSVNHRYLTVSLRAPVDLSLWEAEIREGLRQVFERGHFTVTIRWLEPPAQSAAGINVERAQLAAAKLRELARVAGVEPEISLDLLARQPDVFAGNEVRQEYRWAEAEPAFRAAAAACQASRRTEGAALAAELSGRLEAIDAGAADLAARAPGRIVRERDRLRTAVVALLEGRPLDDTRLVQEIAFLADKLDVTEELVRLRAHLAAAREAVASDQAIGKRLGFLAQEIGREVNTVGSKANDAPMQHTVVEMKGELERFREQLENLE